MSLDDLRRLRRLESRNPRKYRITILNETARSVIKKFKPREGYIFPLKWRDPNALFYAVHKIRELSGVKDFHFHQLRHTVSTIVANESGLATAKSFLGHADLKTTMQYTHPALSELRRTVVKLEETISSLVPKAEENKIYKEI
jgi:integrase